MSQPDLNVPWRDVVKFIRQLNHDLRNHLNAVELQAAFLGEIVTEAEAKGEISRLREMTGGLGADLQRLSRLVAPVQLSMMPYLAHEFVEDLRAKLAADEPEQAATVEWKISLGEEMLEIDPQLLEEAFEELFANALAHERGAGPLIFEARKAGKSVEFALREPKTQLDGATEDWGLRPLAKLRHGHYALGLVRARSIFEAHHGTFRAEYDATASLLSTSVALPCRSGS